MKENWSSRLKTNEHSLTKTERNLVRFINRNPETLGSTTLNGLSKAAGISKPLIISCYKKLGYADYRDLQRAVLEFYSSHIDSLIASKRMEKRVGSIDSLLEEAVEVDIRSLERLQRFLSTEDLKSISVHIHDAESIYIFGEGTGFYPAHYLCQRLRRYGLRSILVEQDPQHCPDMIYPANEKDLIILFHYSDSSRWLYPLLEQAEEKNIASILFSGTIHPDFVQPVSRFIHIPRGEINFKNSMAVPMHAANQLLLSYEIIYREEVDGMLKELEVSRKNWNRDKE